MGLLQVAQRLIRHRRLLQRVHLSRGQNALRQLTEDFCRAPTLPVQVRRVGYLFSFIFSEGGKKAFAVRLPEWISLMEGDPELSAEFQKSWVLLLSELNSVPLFAEAGLPAHPGLLPEILRRLSSRVLPTARANSDAGLLFTSIFSSPQAVERFSNLDPDIHHRFVKLL